MVRDYDRMKLVKVGCYGWTAWEEGGQHMFFVLGTDSSTSEKKFPSLTLTGCLTMTLKTLFGIQCNQLFSPARVKNDSLAFTSSAMATIVCLHVVSLLEALF
jgi:hypothetical protein